MGKEEVFAVHVKVEKTTELHSEDGDSVVMIAFSGHVTGEFFNGKVLDGGIDTQIIGIHGDRHTLSARYMLQGKDYTGEACQIYIENNGSFHQERKDALFLTYPKMITNSKALSFLNNDIFIGEGFSTDTGVCINIYRWI